MPRAKAPTAGAPTSRVELACKTCETLEVNSFGVDEWEARHREHLRMIHPKASAGRQFTREAYVRENGTEKFLWRSCPCGSKHLVVEKDNAVVLSVTLGGEA